MGQKAGKKWTAAADLQPTFLLPPTLQGANQSDASWHREDLQRRRARENAVLCRNESDAQHQEGSA